MIYGWLTSGASGGRDACGQHPGRSVSGAGSCLVLGWPPIL